MSVRSERSNPHRSAHRATIPRLTPPSARPVPAPRQRWLTLQRAARIAAWLSFLVIVVATLSPIQFRPPNIISMNGDRAAAFAVLSALLVIAYPRHWLLIAAATLCAIIGLELLQYVSPTRHPAVANMVVKAFGGAVGMLFGLAVVRVRDWLDRI